MQEVLARQIADFLKTGYDVETDVDFSRPEPQFGDLATNVAMKLANQVGKNPREIAEAIVASLATTEGVSEATVAGPGFINIRFDDAVLWQAAQETGKESLKSKKILVEYSDPNPFKPLHAGHLYTTLVGDILSRLVEYAGAETIRLNYGGDVGLHVARSMWAIVKTLGGELPEKLQDVPVAERPAWLGERYVQGTAADEDDPVAHKEIVEYNKRVYKLHEENDHDSPFAQIYWTCRHWSYDYFPELYRQLNVKEFDRFIPESEITPLGLATVREQLQKGVFEESDGAVVFKGEPYGLHTRVFINSHGLPLYETKDVGLSLTKWRDYHFDESIIITAVEQQQYMRVVIKAIEQFAPEPAHRTRHLTHGAVKLTGGVKMSSRRGNVVMALDLLQEARDAVARTGREVDEQVVLAAVKYTFARVRIGGDIIYNPDESVALEGNSGPYLQYAHARAASILAKAQSNGTMSEAALQSDERMLLRKLSEYRVAVQKATEELSPHHICTYLYELAQEFNRFYEKNRVMGDERESVRLALVGRYKETLAHGLGLLGIAAPEKL